MSAPGEADLLDAARAGDAEALETLLEVPPALQEKVRAAIRQVVGPVEARSS